MADSTTEPDKTNYAGARCRRSRSGRAGLGKGPHSQQEAPPAAPHQDVRRPHPTPHNPPRSVAALQPGSRWLLRRLAARELEDTGRASRRHDPAHTVELRLQPLDATTDDASRPTPRLAQLVEALAGRLVGGDDGLARQEVLAAATLCEGYVDHLLGPARPPRAAQAPSPANDAGGAAAGRPRDDG